MRNLRKRSRRSRRSNGFADNARRAGCRRGRVPASAGGVRGRPADRLARLSPDCARRRRRQRDQGEREHIRSCASILHASASICAGTAPCPSTTSSTRRSGTPYYFDCNPRLVEPMSAVFAGLDLVELLLRVSRGETPAAVPESQRRPHPYRLAGAAGLRGAGGEPAERLCASAGGCLPKRERVCRQQGGTDAGARSTG